MSVFTFADEIGNRKYISKDEINFLIKTHNVSEGEAIKILQTLGLEREK